MLQNHLGSLCWVAVLGAALLLAGRGIRTDAAPPAGSPLKAGAADAATPSLVQPPSADGDDGVCLRSGKAVGTRSSTSCQRAGGFWRHGKAGTRAGGSGGAAPPGEPEAGTSLESAH